MAVQATDGLMPAGPLNDREVADAETVEPFAVLVGTGERGQRVAILGMAVLSGLLDYFDSETAVSVLTKVRERLHRAAWSWWPTYAAITWSQRWLSSATGTWSTESRRMSKDLFASFATSCYGFPTVLMEAVVQLLARATGSLQLREGGKHEPPDRYPAISQSRVRSPRTPAVSQRRGSCGATAPTAADRWMHISVREISMRVTAVASGLRVKAFAGVTGVLLAFNLECDNDRKGLLGFAIERRRAGEDRFKWLCGMLDFPGRKHAEGDLIPTQQSPIQKFRWSDYTVRPGTAYTYRVHAVYGDLKNNDKLDVREGVEVTVQTATWDIAEMLKIPQQHHVLFNRAAGASQAFSRDFSSDAAGIDAARQGKEQETRTEEVAYALAGGPGVAQ